MGKNCLAIFLFCAVSVISCSKYDLAGVLAPGGAAIDERFRQSMEYNDSAGYRTINVASEEYRFYAFSDAHIFGTSRNLDSFVWKYLDDNGVAPFVLFLGDMVKGKGNYGIFREHTEPLSEKGEFFVTPGNHDLYFSQWSDFRAAYHTSVYWFEVQCQEVRDLFISLDSAGGTLGTEQRGWLEDMLESKAPSCRNIVVFTHTHFFKRDSSQELTSNFTLEETYDLADLFSRYGVKLVISGHDHIREDTMFRGVRYVVLDSIEDGAGNAAYAVVTIGKDINVNYISI